MEVNKTLNLSPIKHNTTHYAPNNPVPSKVTVNPIHTRSVNAVPNNPNLALSHSVHMGTILVDPTHILPKLEPVPVFLTMHLPHNFS